jgi:hypothetical protein
MPSGRHPPQGLYVTIYSGPHPPQGGRAFTTTAELNRPESGTQSVLSSPDKAQEFTRTETVSVRLTNRRLRPFYVLVSIETPGAILIESVHISICEGGEPVCNIPIPPAGVALKKRGDSQVFPPTHKQFAAILEHLERGNTVKVTVQYLAAEESELKISIIDTKSRHKLGYIVAMLGVGFAAQSILKQFPGRRSAPAT